MKGPFSAAMGVAASGMRSQGVRLRVVSENIANANVPGYQRKLVSFESLAEAGEARRNDQTAEGVAVKEVFRDDSEGKLEYDPNHPLADAKGYVRLSNVNSLIEMTDMREANRAYQANLTSFDQARKLFMRTLDLIRN